MNWTLILIVAAVFAVFFVLKRLSWVSADAARKQLHAGALVVDVRSPGEFNSGHLPGALNLPLGDLKTEASRRLPDKSKVLLVHCLSGTRSAMARRTLKGLGYQQVFNLGSYGRAASIVGRP